MKLLSYFNLSHHTSWSTKQLQFASNQLAQEHKEQDMNKISKQRDVKNKGLAIQMLTLNTLLVEVHQELARTIRVAKDMSELCKRTRKASEVMTKEWPCVNRCRINRTIATGRVEIARS